MCNTLRTWWLSPLIWMTLWYKIFSNKSYLVSPASVCFTFYSLAFLELSRGSQMVPTSTSVSWKLTESLRGTLIETWYSILLGPNYIGDKFWVWTCQAIIMVTKVWNTVIEFSIQLKLIGVLTSLSPSPKPKREIEIWTLDSKSKSDLE